MAFRLSPEGHFFVPFDLPFPRLLHTAGFARNPLYSFFDKISLLSHSFSPTSESNVFIPSILSHYLFCFFSFSSFPAINLCDIIPFDKIWNEHITNGVI